jgi:hypothetical protein
VRVVSARPTWLATELLDCFPIRSYSTDTIFALTFLFCVIHIAMHDYAYINNAAEEQQEEYVFTRFILC